MKNPPLFESDLPSKTEALSIPAPHASKVTQPELKIASKKAAGSETFLLETAQEILEKQYRVYTWHDAKTQALITTNSLLFAAVGFLFREALKDWLATILLLSTIFFLAGSLIIALRQIIPRISGLKNPQPSIRSIRGICEFPNANDYSDAFMRLTPDQLLNDTVRQFYGMAGNNMRSYRITRNAVVATYSAVICLTGVILVSAIAARGYHLHGAWESTASLLSAPRQGSPSPPSSSLQGQPVLKTESALPPLNLPARLTLQQRNQ